MKLNSREHLLSTFHLNNFYSLAILSRLFEVKPDNRILFFHINDYMNNLTNHYNRWLNDSFWSSKVPIENLKFIKMNYTFSVETNQRINYYLVLEKIMNEAQYHFDKPKTHILFVNSDTIIGPKILSCFSLDLNKPNDYLKKLNPAQLERYRLGFDCYNAVYKKTKKFSYYSFLYTFNGLHQANELSGMLVWRIKKKFKITLLQDEDYFLNKDDKIEIIDSSPEVSNIKDVKGRLINITPECAISKAHMIGYIKVRFKLF